ncbi:MAG: HAMP domain-containing protein [Phycisphaerales bacterium]|nr:HAMP domain-containing protein [Phycisphaerales bacterium]MCB9856450.1 HAMP domain-containing protein [Phycisphaerales bacterium]
MSLRVKCALLLIAFELTLAVTLMLTVRHIRHYFENAAEAIASSNRSNADLRRLRQLLRDELGLVLKFSADPAATDKQRALGEQIDAALADFENTLGRSVQFDADDPKLDIETLRILLAQRARAVDRYIADATKVSGESTSLPTFDQSHHLALDRFIGQWETEVFHRMILTAEGSFAALNQSVMILSINMIVGAVLGVLGLVLVRRWVLVPLSELTNAADEFGRGRLDYRADVRTRDELGKLADSMNMMSADLARLGRQMVFRERAAAMGELISYIAHNIRNPLAGIRSLSESCRRSAPEHSAMHDQHDEIVASVERLQRWLREVEHTCRSIDIRPAPVDTAALVNNLVAVFRPMADRRDVRLETRIAPDAATIHVDESHFEQALAAIVGNAIEATPAGGSVTIAVECDTERRHQIVAIADTGPGIPREMRDTVFHPSVSTKRDGQGLGLAMARKIAALHAGELTFECPITGGTIFRFDLPLPQEPDATNA